MRRAFVVASNGPSGDRQLKWAELDGDRIAEVLAEPRCGFVVCRGDPISPNETRSALMTAADSCAQEDTFLVYFAGHGVLTPSGLHLLLNYSDPDKLLSTALLAADLIVAMRGCRARNRVLILDCCNAGQLVRQSGLRLGSTDRAAMRDLGIESDTFDIILASDVLEAAHEVESLEGGFLTWALRDALGPSFVQADEDLDRAISVDEALKWVQQRAATFTDPDEPRRRVPIPQRLGVGRGVSYLTLPPRSWIPYEVLLPDHCPAVVLPIFPIGNCAFVLGKYPVTNAQVRRWLPEGSDGPESKRFANGHWRNKFKPWLDANFCGEDLPAVGFDYRSALSYCEYLLNKNKEDRGLFVWISLPPAAVWDIAAFDTAFPVQNPRSWRSIQRNIHENAEAPAACVNSPERTSARGLTDLIGNVWEWCAGLSEWTILLRLAGGRISFPGTDRPSAAAPQLVIHSRGFPHLEAVFYSSQSRDLAIRGGSFYDDLRRSAPFLAVGDLEGGEGASHADLGFRVAGLYPLAELPKEVAGQLSVCPPLELIQFDVPAAA